ncbi:hypothetical protein ACD578_28685 (plasmid) [Microvirga sp. RSM25]|uniref:hypothetical protein n=1 Tax=Microvirga sp. RSM25 TaxID=3273802 RepID=UPI00384E5128
MDEALANRYMALLTSYDAGGQGLLANIKGTLIRQVGRGVNLRPDAALILLTLYDQMILRPYMGHFPLMPEGDLPLPNATRAIPDFSEDVLKSLDRILDELRGSKSGEPVSSHEVLRAIEGLWSELSAVFLWS